MANNTTQAIIEFIPDTRKVESAIQELSKSGAVTDGAATAFKEGNAALEKRIALLKENNTIMSAVQKGTSAMAGELLKSVAIISQLNGNLQKLINNLDELPDAFYNAGDAAATLNGALRNAGSDLSGLDKAAKAADVLAAGIGVLEGTTELLGIENENLTMVLGKVQAAMSILNGVMEVQRLLKEEYIASLIVENRTRVINNAGLIIENGLQSTSVVVRTAATAAQTALNAAMAVSPLGWLAIAVGGVIAAFSLFGNSADDATVRVSHLSDELDRLNKSFDGGKISIDLDYSLAVAKAKAAGATLTQMAQLDRKKIEDESALTFSQMFKLNALGNEKRSNLNHAYTKEAKRQAQQEVDDTQAAYDEKFAHYLKLQNDLKINDQEMIVAKKMDAEIAARESKEQADKRIADANNAIKEIREANRVGAIDRKSQAQSDLLDATEGSKKELEAKIEIIKAQRDIEINSAELRMSQIKIINRQADEDIAKTRKEFADKNAHEAADIEVAKAQNVLAAQRDGSDAYLAAQKELLQKQAALKKLEVQQSASSAKMKEQKVLQIESELNKSLYALDQQAFDKRVAQQQAMNDALANLASAREDAEIDAMKREADRKGGGHDEQQAVRLAELDNIKDKRQRIEDEFNARQYDTMEEYKAACIQHEADLVKNTEETAQKQYEIEKANADRRKEIQKQITEAGFQILNDAASAYFEADKARRDAALQESLNLLDRQKEAEVSKKGLTEAQKTAIEKRYAEQARRLKMEAAKKEKQAAKTQALINGALAITNALATVQPFWAALVAAGVAAASTAVQIAKINSTPIPQFAKGTKNAPKGMAWVGEEGPELVKLNGGEAIYTARESQHIYDQWAANIPTNSAEMMGAYMVDSKGGLQIDYDKLGKAVAEHIPASTIVQNTIDSDGLHSFVLKAGSRMEVRNRRYGG